MPKESRNRGGFDFRKSYAELEEIVSWFGQEDADLDESMVRFERGMKLAKACRSHLEDMEGRAARIRKAYGA